MRKSCTKSKHPPDIERRLKERSGVCLTVRVLPSLQSCSQSGRFLNAQLVFCYLWVLNFFIKLTKDQTYLEKKTNFIC